MALQQGGARRLKRVGPITSGENRFFRVLRRGQHAGRIFLTEQGRFSRLQTRLPAKVFNVMRVVPGKAPIKSGEVELLLSDQAVQIQSFYPYQSSLNQSLGKMKASQNQSSPERPGCYIIDKHSEATVGSGLGRVVMRKLLRIALAEAQQAGVSYIRVYPSLSSRGFYLKQGFHPSGVEGDEFLYMNVKKARRFVSVRFKKLKPCSS